jgi:uncharacterized membrane protein YkvA (DUF1232 family)
LAQDPITIELNPRERRFYDRFRARVASVEPSAVSGARDLLLLLPDLTILLMRLLRDPRVSLGDKGVALLGLSYVLSPIDLIPGILLGPIGLLDDLFVVAATLSRVLNHVHPDVVRSHWPGRGDALDAIQRVTRWTESFVKRRLRGVFRGVLGPGHT